MRTNLQAVITQDAACRAKDQFRLIRATLGVVTPATFQRAAFEKHGCSNARTIMYGISSYVENGTSSHLLDLTISRKELKIINGQVIVIFRK
jgi:hypothetical protein